LAQLSDDFLVFLKSKPKPNMPNPAKLEGSGTDWINSTRVSGGKVALKRIMFKGFVLG
jgi:hypothetical protein